jgi:hypothetical protein
LADNGSLRLGQSVIKRNAGKGVTLNTVGVGTSNLFARPVKRRLT